MERMKNFFADVNRMTFFVADIILSSVIAAASAAQDLVVMTTMAMGGLLVGLVGFFSNIALELAAPKQKLATVPVRSR
ncbi:MAG: hypothetical protein HY849_08835 [Nitrosomonadales bacterium]|nr:hypothetical protein [Nitrosomonadales bacterium]